MIYKLLMSKFVLFGLSCLVTMNVSGKTKQSTDYQQDWQSPQAIISALYESISAGPNESRDWSRFRSLFFANAHFTVALQSEQFSGLVAADVEQMIQQTEAHYKSIGFHEIETEQQVVKFKQMASVYSLFEVKHVLADTEPLMRGLNHFQLLFDGDRWWIISNTSMLSDESFDFSGAIFDF